MRNCLKKYVGNASFYKMAMVVALPIMVQTGITNFVSMLDNIMVGSVGTEEMTGVAIANQLIFVFNLMLFGAVSGAGIFGAQFHGNSDHEGVRYAFRFKIIVCTILTAAGVAVFFLWGDSLIRLYLQGEGTPEQIEASFGFAKKYLRIMMIGFVPFMLSQCYSGTLRETGHTVLPMAAGLISVAVNLCFNALLIYGKLGFPRLGSAGAAIATVIARFTEAAIVIVWTHISRKRNPFAIGAYRSLRIPKKLVGSISKKTLPLMINETLWAGGMALLTQCYSWRGYDVVSACNIASTISNVFNVAFLAMGSAIGIIVGQQLGAGKMKEAVDTDRKLIVFSVGICFVIGGALALIAPIFPRLYETTAQIRELAASFIVVCAVCMPLNSLSNACYFTVRSGGKTLITFLFDSVYVCLLTVPVAFVLTRYTGLPIVPLYLCCQLLDIGKCVIGLILIKKGVWINNIVGKETQNEIHSVLPET